MVRALLFSVRILHTISAKPLPKCNHRRMWLRLRPTYRRIAINGRNSNRIFHSGISPISTDKIHCLSRPTFLDALLPAEGSDFVPKTFLLVEIFARNWRPRRLGPTQGAHFCGLLLLLMVVPFCGFLCFFTSMTVFVNDGF